MIEALDQDAPGRRAAPGLQKNLQAAGFAAEAAVWEIGDGKGLDDLLKNGGELFAELDVDGLWTLAPTVRLGLERHPRAFVGGRKTCVLQSRDMQKDVLTAIVRRNETEAARMIEKLDRPGLTH